MSWFFETRIRESEKNGRIVVKRLLGDWWVYVDNCGETTPVLHSLWEDAFEKLKLYSGFPRVKRILMLGLGAGGEIKTIRRFFPKSTLTVIEYDPEMIDLAKELKLYMPAPFPKVICEDAGVALPLLKEKFDVIIVDMFKGATPSPLSGDPAFQKALDDHLDHGGILLANVYKHEHVLNELARGLFMAKKWRFGKNHMSIFGKKEIIDSVYDGYRPTREWPDYDPLRTMKNLSPRKFTDTTPGIYWCFGPFSFEKYLGTDEPVIKPLPSELRKPFRIIMWQRPHVSERPRGWSVFTEGPSYTFALLKIFPEYHSRWDESTKRARRRWLSTLTDQEYRIEAATYDEFIDAYRKSTLPFDLRQSMPHDIRNRMKNPLTSVSFLVARRIRDGKIVAGVARLKSSVLPVWFYIAGFYLKEVRHIPVMIGLIDAWCKDALQAGVRFIDLGYVWRRNRDGSWKGLSLFKSKLNPIYFFYPALLYRFEFNFWPFQKS